MASNLLFSITSKMTPDDKIFSEAASQWDLDKIYQILAQAKKQVVAGSRPGLTNTEKLYLCGLLCGFSPAEIAKKIHKSPKGVEIYLTRTLYKYVKQIKNIHPEQKIKNWRNIYRYLEGLGCKNTIDEHFENNNFPDDIQIKIINTKIEQQNFHNNTIQITINIQLTSGKFPPDEEQKNLDQNEQN